MCQISGRNNIYFYINMKIILLLFVYGVRLYSAVRLSPLENNDKLQDINSQYVAEWQWESWPIKQEPSEQDIRSPGPRINMALWKDSSGPTWYLFGGQPVDRESKKIYSDVWKYSVSTRVWERFFPSQSEVKGANVAKVGGMMTLRANLFDEGHSFNKNPRNYNIVLCGGVTKPAVSTTKSKKSSLYSYTRRKKFEIEKKEEEPKSLAVYAPRTSKSNTVWQIDLKDKLWTAYVCCCDTTNSRRDNSTSKPLQPTWGVNKTKAEVSFLETKLEDNEEKDIKHKNESLKIDSKINKAEDEIENEQQHLKINNLKNKKKINQSKKASENFKKFDQSKKEIVSNKNKTKELSEEKSHPTQNKTKEFVGGRSKRKSNLTSKVKEEGEINKTEEVVVTRGVTNVTEVAEVVDKAKPTAKYCPEFSESGEPVTWCDGNNELLITADISSPQIILWIFNLKTSHWSQQEVNVSNDTEWPGCSPSSSVRYAGNEEEVYMVCSPTHNQNNTVSESSKDSKIPSEDSYTVKVIHRINYKKRYLDSLGEIRLGPYFSSPEGQEIWQNDTKSLFQIIKTPQNDTILLFAHLDSVNLWILCRDEQGKEYFDLVENIWRGSALKWFNKYNAALYNLQFITDTGNSETVLVPNPRIILPSDYWPRERGRFIIRVFKNENLKNQTFENRTREQNLTYELLQSDFKPPNTENQLNHAYSLKVLVFFGISLAIFTVFGFAIFLKRCVNCPPRIRVRNECHKSPLVIRYSVIPDDLLYPVA